MKGIYRLTVGVCILITSGALAEGRAGNGGDGVVCRDASGKVTSVELLDYYEARVMREIEIDWESGGTLTEVVQRKLARLKVWSPLRADLYENQLKSFFNEAKMLTGIELVDVPDSNHIAFPKNCRVEQVAIQSTPRFPEDKRYVINRDLFEKMSVQNQAGLVLHEIIYREALEEGQVDSVGARYFNAVIGRHRAVKDLKSFVELLRVVGLDWFEFNGLKFSVQDSPQFDQDGHLLSATLKEGHQTTEVCIEEYEVGVSRSVAYPLISGRTTFDTRGHVLSTFSSDPFTVNLSGNSLSLQLGGNQSPLRLYPNGKLMIASLSHPVEHRDERILVQGQPLISHYAGQVIFSNPRQGEFTQLLVCKLPMTSGDPAKIVRLVPDRIYHDLASELPYYHEGDKKPRPVELVDTGNCVDPKGWSGVKNLENLISDLGFTSAPF